MDITGFNWDVEKHVRVVGKLGSGTSIVSHASDLVGFGDSGVWTALSNGDGTFRGPHFVVNNFGIDQGWQVAKHPRFMADITGDGKADIVGFGDAGVWVA